jgi:predicted ArsR family transcriptional regulator
MRDIEERVKKIFSSTKKNIARVKKKDLLLLVRLTSGLHDNDGDDGIVVHIHTHFKRLLRQREEKQTTMTAKKRSLFELIEFHGSILDKKDRYTTCLYMFGTIK